MTVAAGPATRKVEGRSVPQPGIWVVDPHHTLVGAVARHMMVTKVRGRFEDVEGAIHVAEDPTESWAEARIGSASINTGSADRDAHLKSPDFLDVEAYPQITFRSTSLESVAEDRWRVRGDLTIRDVTREVELDVEFSGVATNPFGKQVAFLTATTEIDREDFGMTWNVALETGGVLVSRKIKVEIEAQAALQDRAGLQDEEALSA